ncbi:hypothetical protein BV898_18995 [Hypsibius exemplaris]|uniref:Uncharacterized protein n=1 Tax=Hypsibius exemplaris TaxID=2072580 RepID=A0A9X6NII2_HYPEX|nr:hypothetical protein BV898_18995 [Hypsibius exemplaris]
MFRKIQEYGSAERYHTDEYFRGECKVLMALAFVHPQDVKKVWTMMQGMHNRSFCIDSELSQYFLKTYNGMGTRTGTCKLLVAIEFWKCHDRILTGDPRTTKVWRLGTGLFSRWSAATILFTTFSRYFSASRVFRIFAYPN